jgi:hypothetical protein
MYAMRYQTPYKRYRRFLFMFSRSLESLQPHHAWEVVIRLLSLLCIESRMPYSFIMLQVSDKELKTIKVKESYLHFFPFSRLLE